ncbi:hypothetical protein RHIZ_08035 [Rhizobium skierniewicense]|uniref:hypothetical protein n=1 Tax=Rhizobium TaxID=379 RepID=UPI001FAE546A|nr:MULTISPECIES: hypothetical protein [Rhizobium]MCI9865889.1 hypothetical protein [Rhizobium skierniewicense]
MDDGGVKSTAIGRFIKSVMALHFYGLKIPVKARKCALTLTSWIRAELRSLVISELQTTEMIGVPICIPLDF